MPVANSWYLKRSVKRAKCCCFFNFKSDEVYKFKSKVKNSSKFRDHCIQFDSNLTESKKKNFGKRDDNYTIKTDVEWWVMSANSAKPLMCQASHCEKCFLLFHGLSFPRGLPQLTLLLWHFTVVNINRWSPSTSRCTYLRVKCGPISHSEYMILSNSRHLIFQFLHA